jgi:hypothetical protein
MRSQRSRLLEPNESGLGSQGEARLHLWNITEKIYDLLVFYKFIQRATKLLSVTSIIRHSVQVSSRYRLR